MNLVSACGDGGQSELAIGEAAIVVTVPVDANLFAAGFDDFIDGKFDEIVSALRSSMADGVAKDDGARAAANRGGVEALDRVGIGANGVFGDVHRGQIVVDGKLHGFFGGAFEMIDGPVFDEAADRTGAEESGGFDGDADSL